jgi:Ser/Thr protein kinase RdoA (MazF antagonist)
MASTGADTNYVAEFGPLLRQWGVEPQSVDLVSVSENTVFRVRGADKRLYALRIHRENYHTLAELNAEQSWAEALNAFGVHTPKVFQTADRLYYKATDWQGRRRYAGLIEWIDGKPLSEVIESSKDPEFLYAKAKQIGGICAMAHQQAVHWQIPDGFERHALDIDGFLGDSPWWGRFWEAPALTVDQKARFSAARNKLRIVLEEYDAAGGVFGVIHADLHARNLLVVGEDLLVIDFDDSAFGWQLYDIATALFEYRARRDFEKVEQAFLEGYQEHRIFSPNDRKCCRDLDMLGW